MVRYFNIISSKGVSKVEADETILRNIISPCYTYTGNYFTDLAEQVIGTYYDTDNNNGLAVLLTIPLEDNRKSSIRVSKTSSGCGMHFVLYDSDDNIVVENLLYENSNYNLNLTHALNTMLATLIEEACKL